MVSKSQVDADIVKLVGQKSSHIPLCIMYSGQHKVHPPKLNRVHSSHVSGHINSQSYVEGSQ